jgi:hypothetical protein
MTTINGTKYTVSDVDHFPGYVRLEPVTEPGYFDIANDADMQTVDAWCREHQCGQRSGYNKFFFDTDEQITMFKLRWA